MAAQLPGLSEGVEVEGGLGALVLCLDGAGGDGARVCTRGRHLRFAEGEEAFAGDVAWAVGLAAVRLCWWRALFTLVWLRRLFWLLRGLVV